MMLLCIARAFHISTLSILTGFRVTRTATTSNLARGQFFAMHISCSRCSDGSMWLCSVNIRI